LEAIEAVSVLADLLNADKRNHHFTTNPTPMEEPVEGRLSSRHPTTLTLLPNFTGIFTSAYGALGG
jgi:hypothetical protein